MASNAESKEARAERLRQRREVDRLRETSAERDARFVRDSVLAILY